MNRGRLLIGLGICRRPRTRGDEPVLVGAQSGGAVAAPARAGMNRHTYRE